MPNLVFFLKKCFCTRYLDQDAMDPGFGVTCDTCAASLCTHCMFVNNAPKFVLCAPCRVDQNFIAYEDPDDTDRAEEILSAMRETIQRKSARK